MKNPTSSHLYLFSRPVVMALAAVVLLLLAVPVFGQSAAGLAGISGVVRDPSGASVPKARVVISRQDQGDLRSLETNGEGVFSAPALPPGPGYKVSVTAP